MKTFIRAVMLAVALGAGPVSVPAHAATAATTITPLFAFRPSLPITNLKGGDPRIDATITLYGEGSSTLTVLHPPGDDYVFVGDDEIFAFDKALTFASGTSNGGVSADDATIVYGTDGTGSKPAWYIVKYTDYVCTTSSSGVHYVRPKQKGSALLVLATSKDVHLGPLKGSYPGTCPQDP